MKKIIKTILVSAIAFPLFLTSCSSDRDSNPTLDVSGASKGFTLNVPSTADNNIIDVANSSTLTLTCTYPDYGGVPYVVRYYVNVSLDGQEFRELSTSYTSTKMNVDASEINSAIVKLYSAANPGVAYPEEVRQVYLKLRAVIDNTGTGESYSNTIKLAKVWAEQPAETMPEKLYLYPDNWSSSKTVPAVYGLSGNFYTLLYLENGQSFTWVSDETKRGYDDILNINDNAEADVYKSADEAGSIAFRKAGWYVLHFLGEQSGKIINYTLNVYPAEAYIIGATAGGEWSLNENYKLTEPADGTSMWESPAFTGSGELRAFINVPGFDWWRTEFTLYNGSLYYRNVDIPNNWAEDLGSDYSVTCTTGQKLYVDFNNDKGEVK